MPLSSSISSAMIPSRSTANPEQVVETLRRIIYDGEAPGNTPATSPLPDVPYQNPITLVNQICRKRQITPVYEWEPCGLNWHCTLTLSSMTNTSIPDRTFKSHIENKTKQVAKKVAALNALRTLDGPRADLASIHEVQRTIDKAQDFDRQWELLKAKREKRKAKRVRAKQKKSKARLEAGEDQDNEDSSLCSAGSQGLGEGLQMGCEVTQSKESKEDAEMEE